MKSPERRDDAQRGRVWFPVLVFGVALAVRLAALMQAQSDVVFNHPIMDGASYHAWACRIAEGEIVGKGVFYQEPLYAYILGGIYAVAGEVFFRAAVVQAAVDAFNCVLIYLVGVRLFGRGAGLLAGLTLGFYGQEVFHVLMPAKETWTTLFMLLALLGLLRAWERTSKGTGEPGGLGLRWWFAGGLALCGVILLRGNALFLVPAIGAWLWLGLPEVKRTRRLVVLGVWLAGVGLPLMAVSVRNYAVGGQFVLSSAHVGFNYYIGNGPSADGTYKSVPGVREDPVYEGADARALASMLSKRPLSMSETSTFFWKGTVEYDLAHPGEWAKVMGLKFLRFFNGREISDTWTIDFWRERFSLLRAGFVPFWVLVGPAVLGLVVVGWSRRDRAILSATIIGALAGTMVFYMVSRYRLPFVSAFILLGAGGLTWLAEAVRGRAWGRAAWGTGLVALGVALALVPLPGTSAGEYRASDMVNLAEIYKKDGRLDETRQACVKALDFDAKSVRAYTVLGEVGLAEGRVDQAEETLRKAIGLRDEDGAAHYVLGHCYFKRGDKDRAVGEWRRATECLPGFAEAYRDIGLVYLGESKLQGAEEFLTRAGELGPDDAKTLLALGSLYQATGRSKEARENWERVLKVAPPESTGAAIARKNLERYGPERGGAGGGD